MLLLQCVSSRRALTMSGDRGKCCKTLFAAVMQNSPGCRRDFRIKMWGDAIRIYKHANDDGFRNQVVQQLQSFPIQGGRKEADTRGIALRVTETGHEAQFDGVIVAVEDDRDRRSSRLCRQCHSGTSSCDNDSNLTMHEIVRECR